MHPSSASRRVASVHAPRVARDPRVPRSSKAWLWFALAWFISPIDLVPEFIRVAGPLDDAIVAAVVLRHVSPSNQPDRPRRSSAR
jgi:uncharacterized membrane protein YkvA (DUF1232 family)